MFTLPLLLACTPYLYSDDPGAGEDWVQPENSWYNEIPPATLAGEGFNTGQVIPEFRAIDQHGDEVSLWQFYGQLIVLDISTLWCSPCQDLAVDVEETSQEYLDEGVMYLTLLPENLSVQTPTVDDLVYWAESFGITAPVLADTEGWSYNIVPPGSSSGYPRLMLIGRDLRIIEAEILPKTDATIRARLDENL